MITKTTWNYSNEAYETQSITYNHATGIYAQGQTVQLQRSIIAPIPYNESVITNIVAQVEPHNNPSWKTQLVTLLAQEHFFTQNIAEQRGKDINFSTSAYLKSDGFIKNAAKTTAAGAAICVFWFAPSIAAKFAPDAMKALSAEDEEEAQEGSSGIYGFFKKNLTYSTNAWWKILRGEAVSNRILGGVVAVAGNITLLALSKNLFDQLSQTFGSAEFEEWKNQKLPIASKSIPEEFESDPILASRVCGITKEPLRVPCKLNCSHMFEEAWIKNWMVQQASNNREADCPLCRRRITRAEIEVNVSDEIELRLFLLEARKTNNLSYLLS